MSTVTLAFMVRHFVVLHSVTLCGLKATGLLTLFNPGFSDFLEFFLDTNKFVTEPRGEFEFQVSRGVAHLSG